MESKIVIMALPRRWIIRTVRFILKQQTRWPRDIGRDYTVGYVRVIHKKKKVSQVVWTLLQRDFKDYTYFVGL